MEYTYIASNKAIEIANNIFHYNGWSCSIVDLTPDFVCYGLYILSDSAFRLKNPLKRQDVESLR